MRGIYIYAGVLILVLAAGLVSVREVLPEGMEGSAIERFFWRIGGLFYRKVLRKRKALEIAGIQNDLTTIRPQGRGEEQAAEYYIRKTAVSLIVIMAAAFLAILASFSNQSAGRLEEEDRIMRSGYGGSSGHEKLEASDENGRIIGSYEITVDARLYTDEELGSMQEKLAGEISELILGSNESLDKVRQDLKLITRAEGYPFSISWNSSDYELLDSDGHVHNDDMEGMQGSVILTARYSAQDMVWEQEIPVMVLSPELSEAELTDREMKELISQAGDESRTDEYQELPRYYKGSRISWQRQVTDNSPVVFILLFMAGICLYYVKDEQLKESVKKREEEMIAAYPQIVSKLVLYLGAGMTVRAIFEKLAAEYDESLKKGGRKSYAMDEIRIMVNQIKTGSAEEAAYDMFGLRCRCVPYTRLVSLLTQNLRKGNSSLLVLLRSESVKAEEERMSIARKAGEKMATRLLPPMMLMLALIMVIIMIPAFSSF
ncbi:immunoglobulin-like domain-containing protein [Butyrivibrio sp. MC2013]|uniref:immunoglobulin-like domain-containing protein n=1 Tax=Butyrivibrio sp. MC2013 TaxID=1280686 RepID=UPI000423A0FB|nr:immunoglobulin-like domain-containing protein [Butyrivibrio sp. MC2013]